MRRPLVLCIVTAALGAVLTAAFVGRPDDGVRIGVGTVAHDLCSQVFVSGLAPQAVFAESLAAREGLERIAGRIHFEVDRAPRGVTARLAGTERRAVYHEGLGCILLDANEPPSLPSTAEVAALRTSAPALLPDIAGSSVVDPVGERMTAALAHAFEEPDQPPFRRTKAVVVLRDGRVVAERYAAGVAIATPLLGFSLTKSVINALVGILVREGKLEMGAPAPIAAWQRPADPRRAVTVEQLLRMTSGLDLDEEGGSANASDRMFYLARDMAADAEGARLVAPPGTRWAYSSASIHIVSRIVRDAVGGRAIDALGFAQRELFGPLGMRTAVMEVDATGTIIGAHYMLASARDWARFGQLYLEDGVVGGRRILPDGWVAFSAHSSLSTDYGAGFWTNRSEADDAKARADAGMPADAFFASGNLGQRIVILPSQHAVIVRLGNATGPGQDIRGLLRLIREVLDAGP